MKKDSEFWNGVYCGFWLGVAIMFLTFVIAINM